jgi:hypothetical protein
MKKANTFIAASLALLALQKTKGSKSKNRFLGEVGLSRDKMRLNYSGDHIARILKDQILYDAKGNQYLVDYVWKCIPTKESFRYGQGLRPKGGYGRLDEHMVQMSNLPNGERNILYAEEFQARDLKTQMQRAKIDRIVRNFDPMQVTVRSPVPTLGPPVVWTARVSKIPVEPLNAGIYYPTSMALAGNGRLLALSRLTPQQYDMYLQSVREQFGENAMVEYWQTNVPCNVIGNTEGHRGYRSVLVREVFNTDGTPLTYDQALELAGNSQGSIAGAESRLGKALSTFRGLNISGSLPPISSPYPLKRDNVALFISKNHSFWTGILDKLNPTLRSQLIRGGKEANEKRYEILVAVLSGFYLPMKIMQEGFANEKEAQALLSFLPVLGAIQQKVSKGELYPEYNLLPSISAAREFSVLAKGMSYRNAFNMYMQNCHSDQISMFQLAPSQEDICNLDSLGVAFGLFLKRSTQLSDPTSVTPLLIEYMFQAHKDDPRQMTLCGLSGPTGKDVILQRKNRAFTVFVETCLPSSLGALLSEMEKR